MWPRNRQKKGCPWQPFFAGEREANQFANAAIPVIARPRISACTSCVPS